MKILFLNGWQSVPGGFKPTFLAQHGHTVVNPKLPDEDFAEAVRIAQAEFGKHQPEGGSERQHEEMDMDITEVPFNKFVRIARQDSEPVYLLQLGDSPDYENHLGTVHASAQLALAEATSGEYLMQQFPELGKSVLAVVRRLEAKFRNPLKGKVMSRACIAKGEAEKLRALLQTKGRGLIAVEVEVVGVDRVVGLIATVEWFVQKQKTQ